jgi:hypothetical protein
MNELVVDVLIQSENDLMIYPDRIGSFSPGLVGSATYPGWRCRTMIFYAEGVASAGE